MPETATATATPAPTTTTAHPVAVVGDNGNVNVPNNKYRVGDGAIKSLRHSRHSRRHTVSRHHSGGSRDDASPSQLDVSRYSNRSSTSSSMWNSFLKRGRRIYGSAVSVASSITLTEFGESEDFGLSDRSLDARQFCTDANDDSNPKQPQRQTSVTANLTQSNSFLNSSSGGLSSSNSDHFNESSSAVAPPPPPQSNSLRGSDLSPRQPGRKTSIATTSDHASSICANLSTISTLPIRNRNDASLRNSTDSAPQHPSRKKSSHVSVNMMDEANLQEVQWKDLREQAKVFRDDHNNSNSLPLSTNTYAGQSYDNSFSGAVAIDHMMQLGLVSSRQEGVELGQKMEAELGLIYSVVAQGNSFCDSPVEIYQLAPSVPVLDMPSPCLVSVKRKTDTSIRIEEEAPLEERTAKQLTIPPVRTAP